MLHIYGIFNFVLNTKFLARIFATKPFCFEGACSHRNTVTLATWRQLKHFQNHPAESFCYVFLLLLWFECMYYVLLYLVGITCPQGKVKYTYMHICTNTHTQRGNQNLVNSFCCASELFPFSALFPGGLTQKPDISKDVEVN